MVEAVVIVAAAVVTGSGWGVRSFLPMWGCDNGESYNINKQNFKITAIYMYAYGETHTRLVLDTYDHHISFINFSILHDNVAA